MTRIPKPGRQTSLRESVPLTEEFIDSCEEIHAASFVNSLRLACRAAKTAVMIVLPLGVST